MNKHGCLIFTLSKVKSNGKLWLPKASSPDCKGKLKCLLSIHQVSGQLKQQICKDEKPDFFCSRGQSDLNNSIQTR